MADSSSRQEMDTSNGETECTLMELLEKEEELEEDAIAVLGASDDKNCTYTKGYVKRQALYACTTCIPPSLIEGDLTKCAGVCLACSYKCHEGHILVELYTKRHFRCDCGNQKFNGDKCKLEPTKDVCNELNTYNQNFIGLYCTCKRPYPDPEDSVEDDMIQCSICEDWFHCRHLGLDIPQSQKFSEMICKACVEKHTFLANYTGLMVNNSKTDENAKVDVESVEKDIPASTDTTDTQKQTKENQTVEEQSCSKTAEQTSETEDCKMPKNVNQFIRTIFWIENWREQLCACAKCIDMYEKQKVGYLIDLKDTVQAYEDQGKSIFAADMASKQEAEIQVLSSMDRVAQVEFISGYNEMKNSLTEFLRKFAENKRVVKEEDVKEFFSEMNARKKQRTGISHFCR